MNLRQFMHRNKMPMLAKALYLFIWTYPLHKFTGGHMKLSHACGMSERQFRRWIKYLRVQGYLKQKNTHDGANGRPKTGYYCIKH